MSIAVSKPRGYWMYKSNQKLFFDDLGKKLNITKMDDWRSISLKTVLNHGGSFVVHYFNGSLIRALSVAYPDYDWKNLHKHKKRDHWKDIKNQRQFMDRFATSIGIQKPDDWRAVSTKMVVSKGASFITSYYNGSLWQALKAIYPEHQWSGYHGASLYRDGKRTSKAQLELHRFIKELFPSEHIVHNYRIYPDDLKPKGLSVYEFDVFIPSLSLAFEYQGETHYVSSHAYGRATSRKRNDDIKKIFAMDNGITLIHIPFWWNRSLSSLVSTIKTHRMDLLQDYTEEQRITSVMPSKRSTALYKINVAQKYDDSIDPTGWLMMEQWDGIRVYWNGTQLEAKSLKRSIDVPKELNFPNVPFEGELWMGYNNRQRAIDFMHVPMNWKDAKIMVFDAPQATDLTYAQRLDLLKQSVPKSLPVLSVVDPILCQDRSQLDIFFTSCKEKNAKGMVIRNPNAWYFQRDSFFTKQAMNEIVVMPIGGQFRDSNGKLYSSLPIPVQYSNAFCAIRFPPGRLEDATFVSTVEPKHDLRRHFFRYVAGKHTTQKSCRGCGKLIEKGTLCIQTHLIYNSASTVIAFCLSNSCLTAGLGRYSKQINTYHPFENVIWTYEPYQDLVKNAFTDSNVQIIPPNISFES